MQCSDELRSLAAGGDLDPEARRRLQAILTVSPASDIPASSGNRLTITRRTPEMQSLDEISLDLAPKLIDKLYANTRRLRTERRIMLLAEQFANIAFGVADATDLLKNERIVLAGQASDLQNDAHVLKAYVRVSPGDRVKGEPAVAQ